MPQIDYAKLQERAVDVVDNLDAASYLEWLEEWLAKDEMAYGLWRNWAVSRAYGELLDEAIEATADRA